MAGLNLELFVSTDIYESKISQLDGYLVSLNQVLDDYNTLNSKLDTLVTGDEDTDVLPQLKERAEQQITAIKTQITYAQECKTRLEKTLEVLKENQSLASNIVSEATQTAKNVVETSVNEAKIAVDAAEVAAVASVL